MRQFDELLRQGLMKANLDDYTSELDNLPGWEPDFSPRYRRERTRMLANPRSWARRRERPVWKRAARNVACVLLACTVAFGALMAASPTVRAAVNTWLRQITRDGELIKVEYNSSDDPSEAAPPLPWRISGLPEGWTMEGPRLDENGGHWSFYITGDDGWSNEILSFDYTGSNGWGMFFTTSDSGLTPKGRTEVHGRPADRYEGKSSDELVWEEADGALLYVSAPDGSALLEQAAESAAPWTGTPVEYGVGWAPEGCADLTALFFSGVGAWYWVRNHTPLDLYYVNDPICPFRVPPDRTPEEVTVNGLPALFWPSVFSREEWDARVAEECSDANSFMHCGTEEAAVLTWEDPETNTAFRISGIAEKEEMLRMAESVTRKSS